MASMCSGREVLKNIEFAAAENRKAGTLSAARLRQSGAPLVSEETISYEDSLLLAKAEARGELLQQKLIALRTACRMNETRLFACERELIASQKECREAEARCAALQKKNDALEEELAEAKRLIASLQNRAADEPEEKPAETIYFTPMPVSVEPVHPLRICADDSGLRTSRRRASSSENGSGKTTYRASSVVTVTKSDRLAIWLLDQFDRMAHS